MRAWLTWLRQAWTLVVFLVGHANEVYTLIRSASTILNTLDRLDTELHTLAINDPVSQERAAWIDSSREAIQKLINSPVDVQPEPSMRAQRRVRLAVDKPQPPVKQQVSPHVL